MPAAPDITMKVGDTDPAVQVVLKDGSKRVVPLGGSDTVKFRMKPLAMSSPPAFEHDAEILDGPKGSVRYQWQAGDTAVAGLYEADFFVSFGGGVREGSFPNGESLLVRIIPAP